MNVVVMNLNTGKEYHYVSLSAEDALVSCAILEDKKASSLTDIRTRKQYENKIIYGKIHASIGDLTVKI
jgi:hypothetical protein